MAFKGLVVRGGSHDVTKVSMPSSDLQATSPVSFQFLFLTLLWAKEAGPGGPLYVGFIKKVLSEGKEECEVTVSLG